MKKKIRNGTFRYHAAVLALACCVSSIATVHADQHPGLYPAASQTRAEGGSELRQGCVSAVEREAADGIADLDCSGQFENVSSTQGDAQLLKTGYSKSGGDGEISAAGAGDGARIAQEPKTGGSVSAPASIVALVVALLAVTGVARRGTRHDI